MHSPNHYEKQWLSETANQGMVSVVRVTGDAPARVTCGASLRVTGGAPVRVTGGAGVCVTGGAGVCVTDRLLVEPMRPCV